MKIHGNAIPVKITPVVKCDGMVCATFPSMTACAKKLGIQVSHISEVCSGKFKTTHGYSFEKITKEAYLNGYC